MNSQQDKAYFSMENINKCQCCGREEDLRMGYCYDCAEAESIIMEGKDMFDLGTAKTLANDKTGYDVIRLLAVLTHLCQKCAEDPDAWHTRPAFCKHIKNSK